MILTVFFEQFLTVRFMKHINDALHIFVLNTEVNQNVIGALLQALQFKVPPPSTVRTFAALFTDACGTCLSRLVKFDAAMIKTFESRAR